MHAIPGLESFPVHRPPRASRQEIRLSAGLLSGPTTTLANSTSTRRRRERLGIHLRAKTATDVKNSLYIPAQNEFQMFPGHPAKNCLSTVFNSKWPVPTADLITNINDYNLLLPYYDLAPRISSALYNSTTQSQGSAGATQFPSATGIVYDADRLYASVDELMFTAASPSSGPPPVRITRNVASNIPGGGATAAVDPGFSGNDPFLPDGKQSGTGSDAF